MSWLETSSVLLVEAKPGAAIQAYSRDTVWTYVKLLEPGKWLVHRSTDGPTELFDVPTVVSVLSSRLEVHYGPRILKDDGDVVYGGRLERIEVYG